MIRPCTTLLAIALASIAIASVANDAGMVHVQVVIVGGEADKGEMSAALYNSEATYMKKALASARVRVASDGTSHLDFGKHPEGQYAVAVYYDKNSNGKLDAGFLGIPKEPVGFSNNAKGRFGPAAWKAARVELAADVILKIRVGAAKSE